MTIPRSTPSLDAYNQGKLDLWRTASVELASGPESLDPLIQASLHAVLAWLRAQATSPTTLLELFGRPHGPLGPQLRLVGSLLIEPHQWAGELASPPCWWVVKAAYHRRWLELTRTVAL